MLEHDLRPLGDRLVSDAGDVAVKDEQVIAAFVRGDEPETLRVAGPLHGSSCRKNASLAVTRTGKEGA
jgi:hypothetical protein